MNAILQIQKFTPSESACAEHTHNVIPSKPPNIKQPEESERSIEEWMEFINSPSGQLDGAQKKPIKKSKRKRRKTNSPIKHPMQPSPELPKRGMYHMEPNNNNLEEVLEEEPTKESPLEKLVIRSPQMSNCMTEFDDIPLDSCELEELNAEVEAFRKRLEADSLRVSISSVPLFSSPD